jgi:hypothetical protein
MSDKNTAELIQKSARTFGLSSLQLMICTVNSVDSSARTCTVTPVTDNLSSFPAQLMSDVADGILVIPVVGSTVKVLLSELATPTVIQFSEIKEVYIVGGGGDVRIYSTAVELNGTTYGGVMKVTPSVAAWNAIQNDLNLLKTVFAALATASPTILTVAPGLPDAFGVAFASAISAYAAAVLPVTTVPEIENPKVKHGNSE